MIFSHPWLTKFLILVALTCGLVLGGCTVHFQTEPTPTLAPVVLTGPTQTAAAQPTSTIEATAAPAPTQPASPTPTPTPQRSHYTLVVAYDPQAHLAQVNEQIVYANQSSTPLNDLALVVDASRNPTLFKLKSLTRPDSKTVQPYHQAGTRINLPLATPLWPGEKTELDLVYELHLPDQALPLGFTSHQANFSDWYPYLPPYLPGQGWLVEPAGHVGEHLAFDLVDFDVEIHLPEKSGLQVIAASAPGESVGAAQHFSLAGARNFSWSISPIYKLVSTQSGSTRINGYVFPEHVEAGRAATGYIAEALSLFSSLFTPYQHHTFSFVEVDFADGLESDGLFFLNKNYFAYTSGADSGLCSLSVHESAHQWWFGQVGNNQALDPWLDESLATYSELIYYQKLRPELVNWWWQYRVNAYKPAGNVGSSIYDFQSYRPYVNAVYLHGVQFFDQLHQQMGDEAFLAFLRNYASVFGGKQVTPQDFFTLLRQSTAADIQPLKDVYFSKP